MPESPPYPEAWLQRMAALHQQFETHIQFTGNSAEALWSWQQERVRELRQALLLHMPAIYQPPKFRNTPRAGRSGLMAGELETDSGVWLPVAMQQPATDWNGAVVIVLETKPQEQQSLAEQLAAAGMLVVTVPLRSGLCVGGVEELAGRYLRVGRSLLGETVYDCLRVIDFIENHETYQTYEVALIGWDEAWGAAAVAAALDKRVRCLLVGGVLPGEEYARPPSVVGLELALVVELALGCFVPRHLYGRSDRYSLPMMTRLARLYQTTASAERFRLVDATSAPDLAERIGFIHNSIS
ncbi:MAG: hypothetical protein HJJLKODD_02316 [Phycisphaerae bacterium]|nr:hypothetical protein [Phycisphaerae bacterium]